MLLTIFYCDGIFGCYKMIARAKNIFGGRIRNKECPKVKDRYGEPERGSEWELIKILLVGDGNSNKMNAGSNTRLRLTTQVGQAHVATGVPLDLGTNTHSLPTRERNGTPNLESTDQHRSDR
jgi:hypothetical protein